jgi:hypothetical protein
MAVEGQAMKRRSGKISPLVHCFDSIEPSVTLYGVKMSTREGASLWGTLAFVVAYIEDVEAHSCVGIQVGLGGVVQVNNLDLNSYQRINAPLSNR